MSEAIKEEKDKMFDVFKGLGDSLAQSSDNAQKSFVQQQEMLTTMGQNSKNILQKHLTLLKRWVRTQRYTISISKEMEETLLKQMDQLKIRLQEVTTITIEQLEGN